MPKAERGVSLVETMMAVLIATFVITSLGGVVFKATAQNKNQGVEMSRVTVYAQDKIETLTSLDWFDCTETTPTADCNTTGFTGSGWNQGLKAGGTLTYVAGCPTSGAMIGYVDFLDAAGNQYTGADCSVVGTFAYQRQWQVTDVIVANGPNPGLKRVDVIVWSRNAVNTGSTAPSAMLSTYLSG